MEKLMPKVYISYSWSEPSCGITRNWLCPSLKEAGIDYVLDKNDCDYNDNIVEFEKKIGKGDFIIIVVGREYFRSKGCMFEAACVFENGDPEHRVRILSLDDYDRGNGFYSDVVKFWEEQSDENKNLIKKSKAPANLPYVKEQKIFNKINAQLGVIWHHIKYCNSSCFTDLSKGNFEVLINSLLNVPIEPIDLNETEPRR